MAKVKTRYICQECGGVYPRYQAQCYHCSNWNTIVEEIEEPSKIAISGKTSGGVDPTPIQEIQSGDYKRLKTEISEFDRVSGGGIVPGSIILIGGSPGIGKSTLLLSAADKIARTYTGKVLYVTGEESLQQIKMRADRLGANSKNLLVLSEVDLSRVLSSISNISPSLVIIDSIQTMIHPAIESASGSVSQVRECAALLQRASKSSGIPIILVGHITKSGSIAGPMVLEHIVDAVLFFEGEGVRDYRILRSLKNRFGSTQEIGVFIMEGAGLKEVDNPSEFFLSQLASGISGSVVVPVLEGTRTLLVEVQGLVTQTSFGIPARRAEGVSVNRVSLLLAVMEKRARMILGGSDVFVNVVGGIRADEPAVDLGIVVSIASSFRDLPLDSGTCVMGEVGLGGEVRGIIRAEDRIREAARMGFEKIILPTVSITESVKKLPVKLIGVNTISEALGKAFGK
jgi:DNA repair protein RadA/Sms